MANHINPTLDPPSPNIAHISSGMVDEADDGVCF